MNLYCLSSDHTDCSVVDTLDHFPEQPPVDVQLAGLMCGLKCEHMMYIKVETEEY